MPQGPIQVTSAIKKSTSTSSGGVAAPAILDPAQALLIGKGLKSALNIPAQAATLLDATARRICKVIVNTAASGGTGAIYDKAAAAGVGAANLVFAIPQTVGIYDVDFPLTAGLVVAVGTAGVISLSYQ